MRALALVVSCVAATTWGQVDALEARKVQLEKLRGEVANQVQLQGFDLIDELVIGWKTKPPFDQPTPVVFAEVSVPVGFGSGLTAMLENHLLEVVLQNKETHVLPAHCPACTSTVVHSGAKATIVSRGVDHPETLLQAGIESGAHHALFLDFEFEGAALVLRARITELTPDLRIVAARTLTTTTSAAAMLRAADHLKTAEEARAEYLEIIDGRGLILVPVRLSLKAFAIPENQAVQSIPTPWIQSGIEVALSRARGWTATLLGGIAWLPETAVGWSIYARIARLLGTASSLTTPDVFVFMGAGFFTIYGTGALALKNDIPTIDDITLALQPNRTPSQSVGSWQLGLEVRVRNRVSGAFYFESAPYLDNSPAIGRIVDFGLFRFHSYGFEVSFWF